MSHRRIIIGDVHGHYQALISLLEAIAPRGNDQVYFLGDLIDRGPQSAQVVDLVIQHNYFCLLGNHEQMLLEAYGEGDLSQEMFQAWLSSGGYSTLVSYNQKVACEHLDWMQTLPTHLDLGDVWLVHAGVHPQIPLAQQSPQQFCWIREEFQQMTQPYFTDKLIIAGHTITFTLPGVQPGQLAKGAGWLNIDTGAYHPYNGWLTALDLSHNLVYQVNTNKNTLRTLPLEEAVSTIDPALISARRLRKRS